MIEQADLNTIKEIYPGQFQIILNFATNNFIEFVLSKEYKYAWVSDHSLQENVTWKKLNLPLTDFQSAEVLARFLKFDFILETEEFEKMFRSLRTGIRLVQMNKLPPYYINLNNLHGRTLYDKLKLECDYLFDLNIPSAIDYGTIVSCHRDFLQNLLENPSIDWANLP